MMAVKLKGTVTVDHRLDLYARLSYCSPDTTATFLIHGMSPFMLWRHQQTQSSYRRPRQAPFFVPQAGARQVRYGSAVERGAMCDTLKGQRCSFGRQPSLAPLHEAYAHGVSNYSVSPLRKTTSVVRERRTQARLLASAGVAYAFFLWGWPAGSRALQAQATQRHKPLEAMKVSWSGLRCVWLPEVS